MTPSGMDLRRRAGARSQPGSAHGTARTGGLDCPNVSAQDDILFGNIALGWGWISKDLLQNALMYQQAKAPDRPLGQILVAYGLLSAEQVGQIAAYQAKIRRIRTHSSTRPAVTARDLSPPNPPWRPEPATESAFTQADTAVATASPNPDEDPLVGTVIKGCLLNYKLGDGAMASVYLAHHQELRKDVVVKVLKPESAAKQRTVERFRREASAMARLEHPNVCMVYDVGTTAEGRHYMIMQYVDGPDLEKKIQSTGRFSLEEATRTVYEVALGLQAAHQQGVIHRDVKPENVLITATGQIKVSDFGLAKDQNLDPLTMEGSFIGTPLYMAPEIGREQVDGRADIYSLGVCFYYLLTGVQPFRDFSGMEILRAIAHDKIRPPEAHFPEIPVDHRRVLGKMLEKSRDQRYLEMSSLIRDLEALQRGQPVSAGEPGLWGPLGSQAAPTSEGEKITRQSQRLKRKETRPAAASAAAGEEGGGLVASLAAVPPLQLAALGGALILVFGLAAVLLGVVAGLF